MESGKKKNSKELLGLKIVNAIRSVESTSQAEIKVYLSWRWFEKNPTKRAKVIFSHLHIDPNNGILLYLNLRRKKFAIVRGKNLCDRISSPIWNEISQMLEDDLNSTHYENAVVIALQTLGIFFRKYLRSN